LNDPHVVDVALFANISSEVNEASLDEVPYTGTPQDDKFQLVHEEEN
jgi:hypothetical protein